MGPTRRVALAFGTIVALAACMSRRPVPSALPTIRSEADAVPVGCSPLHGGSPAVPPAAPTWRRGTALGVASADSAALVILYVVSARDTTPVEDASVLLGPSGPVPRQAISDATGHAIARVAPGRMPVIVHRVGFLAYSDTVTIRAGSADTLRLGLGSARICFS